MKKLLLTALMASTAIAYSQDGTWDSTFNIGTGANAPVNGIDALPDGKILIAGQFAQYNGQTVNGLARLTANGDLDTSFTSPATPQLIYKTLIEEDGSIMYATIYPGSILRRLDPDGFLDDSFIPPVFPGLSEIVSISKQGNKYIVSGAFQVNVNSPEPLSCIVRLNANGSLDETFAPVRLYAANTPFAHTRVLPDGKIIAVGKFEYYGETAVANLIRLNADGTLDDTFDAGTGIMGQPMSVAIQPDGKIIVGGLFASVNGFDRNMIVRINADGSVDDSFVPPTGDTVTALDLIIQPDGKIIAGGNFHDSEVIFGEDDDSVPVYIKRFNANGTLDTTFISEQSVGNQVLTLSLQDDGKLLAGGWFDKVGGVTKNRLARLNNTVLSVKDYQMAGLSVYPNPVTDKLTIDTGSFTSATATVSVYDITGKMLYNAEQAATGNIQVDMASYNSGLYFVTVSAGNKTLTQKVIKN
ncbi:T9SS type A sorting domain-containing protein [Flavobacterium zepuense]|uniref:T9SS type A sorting domain-containing protein n=1 Tax=Flavobacterium zepuense TaxID=2593302 RepID=A0A552UVN7_9FLAO|nr:T9SS type A sorting domain-containing protein [Flavobacterium zepuense]TRW22311.1 T9SS type A sorting domain-containing protein [Flavobacterium zepuense]